MRRVFASIAVVLLSGCITIGRPFPGEKVRALTLGKTSQADALAAFGEPFRTGLQDGDLTWTYLQYHVGVVGEPTTRDLTLRFGADGALKSYSYNTNK